MKFVSTVTSHRWDGARISIVPTSGNPQRSSNSALPKIRITKATSWASAEEKALHKKRPGALSRTGPHYLVIVPKNEAELGGDFRHNA